MGTPKEIMAQKVISQGSAVERTPSEVWMKILEHFEAELFPEFWQKPETEYNQENAQALSSMSQTCRKINPIANAYLYRSIDLDHVVGSGLRQLLLLTTLADQPWLGKYVRHLHTIRWSCLRIPNDRDEWKRARESIRRRAEARDTSSEVKTCLEHWLDEVKTRLGHWLDGGSVANSLTSVRFVKVPFVAVPFVALLPDLQVLECEIDSHDAVVNHLKYLPSLKEVVLRKPFDAKMRPVSVVRVAPAFAHPSVKIIRLSGFRWRAEDVDVLNSHDARPYHSVDTLNLVNFDFDASGLSDMFQRFPKLKHFSYEFNDPPTTGHPDWIKRSEFGDVLRANGGNLETLTIAVWGRAFLSHQDMSHIGSLQSLKSLKTLRICASYLARQTTEGGDTCQALADMLPKQLESIQFLPRPTWEDSRYTKNKQLLKLVVRNLVATKHSQLKKLELVWLPLFTFSIIQDEDREMVENDGGWILKERKIEIWDFAEFSKSQNLASTAKIDLSCLYGG